jgi:ATPase subunit of ABC transporter with duplicated ATPase domains
MIEIGVNKISKMYGANKVFENVSFELNTNEIIGLIGQNGTGKTTLMKILMKEENAEGEINIRKGIKLSYLNQIPVYDESDKTIDILYKGLADIQSIKNQMSILESEMAILVGDDLHHTMNKYSQFQSQFDSIGGYEVEERISKIVTGLELELFISMPFNMLSGGEKTRAMLGKVLLENPDVLLLDEPTNHLDIRMVSWLEDYLHKYNGSAIIISHDRYFLDRVVSKIIELHPDGIEIYYGNYSHYKIEKARRFEEAMKNFLTQQKKIKGMEDQIKRYRIWGNARDSEKMYRKAKELEKRLSKIDKIDKPTVDQTIKLNFEQQERTGKRVYNLKNISKSFDNKQLFNNLNLEILYQDNLAIIGPNGSGKSTLFKIIRQELQPDEGQVEVGARLKVGYLSQDLFFEDENKSILEAYQDELNCTILQARSSLASVLFTKENVFKPISSLSGGERNRLKLLMLMDQNVNVLLLDEPTNHLDIESREILEDSLLAFDGTVIAISHDRYFINTISNRIAEIHNKTLKIYDGNYDAYIAEKQKEKARDEVINNRLIQNKVDNTKSNDKKDVISSEKLLDKLQLEIEINEALLSDIEQKMKLNGEDLELLQKLYNEKCEIEKFIEELYSKLEKLM